MTVTKRTIALVARKLSFEQVDAERRAYWADKSPADRIIELESLRRMWPEIAGDPDIPLVRVVYRRRRGAPAIKPPAR